MKTYIGIDPGSKGFVTIRQPNGSFEFIPIADTDIRTMAKRLAEIREANDCFAVMEEIHAVLGSSAKATFAFGEVFGLLKGLLIATGVPYQLVPPKTWQKEIWTHQDIVEDSKDGKKKVNTKQTSFNAARRLFPDIDLRKSERCRNLDDNKCDSLLICEYARRKNL